MTFTQKYDQAKYNAYLYDEVGEDALEMPLEEMHDILREGLERGHLESILILAYLIECNTAEGDLKALYEQAATLQSAYARYKLLLTQLESNTEDGIKGLLELGQAGYGPAYAKLSHIYEGIRGEEHKSDEYAKLGAELDNGHACLEYAARLEQGGDGIEVDLDLALNMYEKALNISKTYWEQRSQYFYRTGFGIECDYPDDIVGYIDACRSKMT